ncbi:hypothetical protein SAMD00019534_078810 [Acytostelium subglobosum LB1]|uniref:hypothetical protein n=1 Tax=Acytostelium subglobosum LB1 TaxID=1410327 RepID=UPI0006448A25|nr:hypothetical protein SAMD00019534_078810 [Acytostelium subglobosum LB1]GAM24706.1 hypothetical protein SAMD00019534_078810 [Acytostelium subglobosum LB1]|eukprot:XP_012752375.1 hypothetical protein SAMD00019534_078810 [Acytostelium subglobosum LB1]
MSTNHTAAINGDIDSKYSKGSGSNNYKKSNGFLGKITAENVWKRIVMMGGMDLRSIALFRFAMAFCVIGDNIERMTDLFAIYTEEGLFPRSLIVTKYSSNYFFPIHLINTSWTCQLVLFLMHTYFAFCMAIGYRTKLMSFLTWAFTISLQAYIGLVGHGGDVYFRLMLFFTMFLPTTEFFAVDTWTFANSAQHGKEEEDHHNNDSPRFIVVDGSSSGDDVVGNNSPIINDAPVSHTRKALNPDRYRYISMATICVLLQMSCMYIASFFHKSGEEWHNGEATFYAISLDYFQTPIARMVIPWRTTLKTLTIAVAKWELLGPLFWYSPVYTDYCRLLGAVGFMALHLGFVLFLQLGLFFWVTFCAQFVNMPPFVWDYTFGFFEKKLMKGQRPVRVYYNIESPLSQYTTLIMKTFFIMPSSATYAPLDKLAEEPSMSTTVNSDVYGEDWFVTIDSNGIRRKNLSALNFLMSKSPLLFWLSWLCTRVSAGVSSVFSRFFVLTHKQGKQSQALSKRPSLYVLRRSPRRRPSRVWSVANNIFCALLFYLILGYNLNIFSYRVPFWSYRQQQVAFLIRFDQGWNMFSPSPPKIHWWHAIHGETDNGTKIELFKDNAFHQMHLTDKVNMEVNFDKPVPFDTTYGNHRWFKFWENGYNSANANELRLETGRYICRQFNSAHFGSMKLYTFKVYFIYEYMSLDGTVSAPSMQTLWEHDRSSQCT